MCKKFNYIFTLFFIVNTTVAVEAHVTAVLLRLITVVAVAEGAVTTDQDHEVILLVSNIFYSLFKIVTPTKVNVFFLKWILCKSPTL